MRILRVAALGLASLLTLASAGCGGEPQAPAPPREPPSPVAPDAPPTKPTLPTRATYEVVAVGEDWGAIEGTVFLGRPIEPSRVRPTRGEDVSWTERESDLLRYDRERLTLAQAFVFLTRIERGKDWPEAMRGETRTLTLTLRDGFLVPHVAWVRRRTAVALVSESKQQSAWRMYACGLGDASRARLVFNVLLSPRSRLEPSDDMQITRVGPNLVWPDCCFDWATAHLVASDHPYVAGPTAEDGAYVLDQVPPGEYEVVAWHGPMRVVQPPENLAQFMDGPVSSHARVTVPPRGRVRLDLTLTP